MSLKFGCNHLQWDSRGGTHCQENSGTNDSFASVLLLTGWMLCCFSFQVVAQTKDPYSQAPVIVVMEPLQFPTRSGTFYPVICSVINRGRGLWEGSLRLQQKGKQLRDFDLVLPDLVVGETPLEFRVSLPLIVPDARDQQAELLAQAVDKTGNVFDLPPVQILSFPESTRTMVMGICLADGISAIPGEIAPLVSSLPLFSGGSLDTPSGVIRTSSVNLSSLELPESAVDYLRFDGVILTSAALDQLRPKQTAALLSWVRAGGSLGVMLPERMGKVPGDFLNELAVRSGSLMEFHENQEAGHQITGPLVWQPGLGQVVLIPGKHFLSADQEPAECQRLSHLLWRVFPNYKDRLQQPEIVKIDNRFIGSPQTNRLMLQENQERSEIDAFLWELLRPQNMGMIPLHVLLLSLVFYILLIGPVDYVILGCFRARRFTWILFPVLTVCFSWGMLRLTNRIMGQNEQIRSLQIVDLDQTGEVLRENTFSLLMFSLPKTTTFSPDQALVMRMKHAISFESRGNLDDRRWDRLVPTYTGRPPGRHEVRVLAEQWSPQKYRSLSIGGTARIKDFDWKKYDRGEPPRNSPLHPGLFQELEQDLMATFGPQAIGIIVDGPRSQQLLARETSQHSSKENRWSPGFFSLAGSATASNNWLQQVSPLGGDTYEDVLFLSQSNPHCWGLTVLAPQGENWVMYRTHYRRTKVYQENSTADVLPPETGADPQNKTRNH